MRLVVMSVVAAAIVGFGWVFSLPSKSDCIASGRIVAPTERHCESSAGYEQLQEHALFHSRETVLGAAILLATGYAVQLFGSLWVSVALSGGRTAARIPLEAHALGLAFLLIAAVRGSGDIDWTNPLAAVLVGGVVVMVLVDVGTLVRSRR